MEHLTPRILKQDMTKIVTPATYAEMKYVTPKTVYNWLRNGTIKGYKIGSRQFVKLD